MRERSLKSVPRVVYLLLVGGLLLQILWHSTTPRPVAAATALSRAPPVAALRVLGFGESGAFARVLMLWLQAFDNQPGISIPFRHLNYDHVISWLDAILKLEPKTNYPLLAATRLYGEIRVPAKQRKMMDFTYRKFLEAPNSRWQSLAHAAFIAKHRLSDLPLALEYAQAIAKQTTDPDVPKWAKQMYIFILEDMDEIESAKVLLGGLLASGSVTDEAEISFLNWRLERLLESTRAADP